MENKKREGIEEFIAESEELLDNIAQSLLELEKSALDSPKPEIINCIFRYAHTLKGMSGMLGLSITSELSHKLEDLLDGVRMGRIRLSQSVLDILFDGLDILREIVGQLTEGLEEEHDIKHILSRIQMLINGKDAEAEEDPLKAAGIDKELISVLTEYETYRLSEAIRLGKHLLEVRTRYPLEVFDTKLGEINAKLSEKGEVVATLPDSGISGDTIEMSFNLVYATGDEKEVIEALTGDLSLGINIIEYRKAGTASAKTPKQEIKQNNQTLNSPADPPKSDEEHESRDEAKSIKSLSPTLRVNISNLDKLLNLVGELVLIKAIIGGITFDMLQEYGLTDMMIEMQKANQALDRRVSEMQEGLIEVRMVPIAQVFDRLTRIIRKTARDLNKEINLHISGEETKLDKSMIEDIADPLMHLIRNSIDHGIEPAEEREAAGKNPVGNISLSAIQKGNSVVLEVEDDGGGINPDKIRQKAISMGLLNKEKEYSTREILNQLFAPGFSTANKVTEISGRGVGLDVVAKNVAKLGGMVDLESNPGKGTTFSISLPITLLIIKALIVSTAGETFAIPLNSVSESLIISKEEIFTIETREVIRLRDITLPIVNMEDIFHLPNAGKGRTDTKYIIVVGVAEKRVGLVVDFIAGQQEIVIKPVGQILEEVPGIAGATELGNRKTILVIDVAELIEEVTS